MKKLVLFGLILGILGIQQGFAQTQNYKTKEDYKAAEPEVIKNIKWLVEHPYPNDDNRKSAERFVLIWLTGCPYMFQTVDEKVVGAIQTPSYRYGGQLSNTYTFGKVQYKLEHPGDNNPKLAALQGVKNVVAAYKILVKADPSAKNEGAENLVNLSNDPDPKKLDNFVWNGIKE